MQKRYETIAYFLLLIFIVLSTVSAQSSNHVVQGRLFEVFRVSPSTVEDPTYINTFDFNFDLDPAAPNQVAQIRLELALPYGSLPESVKIGIPNSSSKLYSCRRGDSSSLWVCTTSGLLLSAVDQVRVIIG